MSWTLHIKHSPPLPPCRLQAESASVLREGRLQVSCCMSSSVLALHAALLLSCMLGAWLACIPSTTCVHGMAERLSPSCMKTGDGNLRPAFFHVLNYYMQVIPSSDLVPGDIVEVAGKKQLHSNEPSQGHSPSFSCCLPPACTHTQTLAWLCKVNTLGA